MKNEKAEAPLKFAGKEFERLAKNLGLNGRLEADFAVDPEMTPDGKPELDDAFRIEADPACCRITGSNARSVLLGVYSYFYHLGVRYLRPGIRYESYPEAVSEKLLNQKRMVCPPLRHRGVCIEGAESLENVLDFIDWLPKIGMNSFFVQFRYPYTFLQRWYAHINNPMLAREDFTMDDAVAMSGQIDKAMTQRGILHHRVGHGWTSGVIGADAQGWDIQEGTLPEEKRRLLAQIDGRRELFHGVPLNTNLCYSSTEVRERFADEVVGYAKEHPEVQYLHLWLADDYNNHCECERCRQQIPTDHYIDLINRIDERLTEEGLATRIVFLLYEELLWAPQKKTIRNPDRFVMMFAPISRSFEASYEEAGPLPKTPPFELNRIRIPVRIEENLAFLRDWQEKFTGDSFVYDYHLGRAHYGDLGYVHIARLISQDLKYLPKLKLNGFIACQQLRESFPNALPDYVMGMIGADPSLCFEDVAADYYAHAYGKNSGEVLAYLSELSALCSCDYFNGKGPRRREDLVPDAERALAMVMKFRGDIAAHTAENPLTQGFWNLLLYHSRYCEHLLKALIAKMQGDEEGAHQAYRDFTELVQSHEKDYQEALDVYRVLEVTKNYTGLS